MKHTTFIGPVENVVTRLPDGELLNFLMGVDDNDKEIEETCLFDLSDLNTLKAIKAECLKRMSVFSAIRYRTALLIASPASTGLLVGVHCLIKEIRK
jgi:hypothetical protein